MLPRSKGTSATVIFPVLKDPFPFSSTRSSEFLTEYATSRRNGSPEIEYLPVDLLKDRYPMFLNSSITEFISLSVIVISGTALRIAAMI